MGLGFALLALSRLPANARLGQLVAFALFASCLVTLGGLTPLARIVRRRSARRRWAKAQGGAGTGRAGAGVRG